jgi:hypothetical protein
MSKIPLPQRGQPLDMSYLYTIAKAINDLSDQGAAMAQSNNFVITDRLGSKKSSKIIGGQIYGDYVTIYAAGATNSSNERSQTINFKPAFASPPIVTATVVNTSTTSTGTDVSLVVQNVTSDSCTVVVKFGSSGLASVGVNIIAVGFPTK